jgi:hypothetical protein
MGLKSGAGGRGAYNMKRVIAILGCRPLMQAIQT